MRRGWIVAALAAAVLAGGGAIAIAVHLAASGDPPLPPGAVKISARQADFAYVIPAGTSTRIDRGERISIVPARLEARVGESIRIENRDRRGYLLGPFYVGPRETLTQRFVSPGTFHGDCALGPSGHIELVVRSA